MAWQDQIDGCFGAVDRIFAGHPLDAQRAKDAIAAAKAAGASQDDFLKEMVWNVYRNVGAGDVREDLFEKQEKRLKGLW